MTARHAPRLRFAHQAGAAASLLGGLETARYGVTSTVGRRVGVANLKPTRSAIGRPRPA